jgi:PAS domain S-box-containing protein
VTIPIPPEAIAWLGIAAFTAGVLMAVSALLVLRRERNVHARAVRERETLFRAILSQSSDAVMVLGPDGRFQSINPRMLGLLGYSRNEMNTLTVGHLMEGDASKNLEVYRVFHQCMARLRFHREPSERLVTRDGRPLPSEIRYYHLHDGTLLAFVRPAAGAAPAAAATDAAGVRDLLDLAPDAALVTDRQGRLTEFNTAAEKLFGCARESVLGRHLDILFTDPAEARRVHALGFAGPRREEVLLRRKPGDRFRATLTFRPTTGGNGEAVGQAAFVREILTFSPMEEQMRMAEQRYWNIVANSTDGIFRSTPDGQWTDANPALLRMLGYTSPEELLSAGFPRSIFGTATVPRSFLPARAADGEPWVFDTVLRMRTGRTLPVRIVARAILNGRGVISSIEGLVRPSPPVSEFAAGRHLPGGATARH